jgi:predicted nicotinamide N-methyase
VHTASLVWDSAFVAIKYLEKVAKSTQFLLPRKQAKLTTPTRILELGSGTGIVGMAAGLLYPSSQVILTDLKKVVPFLNSNLQHNQTQITQQITATTTSVNSNTMMLSNVSVEALEWGNREHMEALSDAEEVYDMVIICDCIWQLPGANMIHQALLQTLTRLIPPLTAQVQAPTVLLVYEERSKLDALSFFTPAKRLFSFTRVPQCELNSQYCAKDILVWHITRK